MEFSHRTEELIYLLLRQPYCSWIHTNWSVCPMIAESSPMPPELEFVESFAICDKVEMSAAWHLVPRKVQLEVWLGQVAQEEHLQQRHSQITHGPCNGPAQHWRRELRARVCGHGDAEQIVNEASSSRLALDKASIPAKLQKIAVAGRRISQYQLWHSPQSQC